MPEQYLCHLVVLHVEQIQFAIVATTGCYRDPGALLAEIAVTHTLREELIRLVLVENGATEMAIRHVEALPVDCRVPTRDSTSRMLRRVMKRMPVPEDAFPVRFQMVTVIVRPGFMVMGSTELNWTEAWLYSNHLMRAINGWVILVTEYGWFDEASRWGGHEPRMCTR